MTTVYVIADLENADLDRVTVGDLKISYPDATPILIEQAKDPLDLLDDLQDLDLKLGDVVCFAGIALRQQTWNILKIAQDQKWNIMPGQIVDHRSLPIPPGTFYFRRAQESNNHQGIPYVMLIGDPDSAKLSWQGIQNFTPEEIWTNYMPEHLTAYHWLSAAAFANESWIAPSWFTVVDLSIRDLDIVPTMYATNHWSDWIAFYPANGNFKLENHAQLNPVWFDRSTKPLEYWKHV